MLIVEDKIISEDILSDYFSCNLSQCKGQCCVEGVCGAPLEESEKEEINKAFIHVKNSLSNEALATIEQQGKYLYLQEHGLVTPTIGSGEGICAYAIKNTQGVVLCAFEKAYNDKKISWKKPISCHLFPIRITKSSIHELLNYEKIDICNSSCNYGKKEKIKLFIFLKEALIRKYGKGFYEALEDASKQ